jgi:hypothetical protein
VFDDHRKRIFNAVEGNRDLEWKIAEIVKHKDRIRFFSETLPE